MTGTMPSGQSLIGDEPLSSSTVLRFPRHPFHTHICQSPYQRWRLILYKRRPVLILHVKVPHETFKAAAHLVVTGRKRKYSDVKIILAHLGGATPSLAPRVAVLSRHMGSQLTAEEMLEDFKDFYYETALTAYDATLTALDKFVQPDHILFGTDFPGKSYSTLSSHASLTIPL